MKTPVLETERLLLRPFSDQDTREVFECWQRDSDVARYMMWESSQDIKKAKEFIDFEISQIFSDVWYRWCITDKKTKVIYGTCLVYYKDEDGCWDISYNLGKKFWGKGYTTEAMQKAMNYAIHTLEVTEFTAAHAVENPASGNVIKKLGFEYVREIEYICNGEKLHTIGKEYRLIVPVGKKR